VPHRPLFRHLIPFVCLLIAVWGGLVWDIDAAWFGHHDANGAWISTGAQHLNTYGIGRVGIIPAINIRPDLDATFAYYTHHPPLIVWVVALNQALFGIHEASARLGSAASALISVAAFFVLVRRIANIRWAFASTLAYAFVPMFLFFGRLPNHEAYALAEILLFAAVFVAWDRHPTRARWWMLAALAVLGVWTAWAAPFVIGLIAFAVFIANPQRRMGIIGLGIVSMIALAALLIAYEATSPGALRDLASAFSGRSSTTSDFYQASSAANFTTADWLTRQFADLLAFMSPLVIVFGVVGFPVILRQLRRDARALALGMLAAGLLYVLVLRNATYEHEFYKIYLLPPLAISTGGLIAHLLCHKPNRPLWRVLRMAIFPIAALSLIWSVFLLIRLHNFTDPAAHQIALSVRDFARPDDFVMTNLPRVTTPMHYYANTYITVQPEINRAMDTLASIAPNRGVLVVWCGGDPPADWRDYPVERDAFCAYIRLR